MNERRRPFRRGRGPRPSGPLANEPYGDADPYRESIDSAPQETESFDAPRPRIDMNGDGQDDDANMLTKAPWLPSCRIGCRCHLGNETWYEHEPMAQRR